MFWCGTVPAPTVGSHIEVAWRSTALGSSVRYDLVSALTRPGSVSRIGT